MAKDEPEAVFQLVKKRAKSGANVIEIIKDGRVLGYCEYAPTKNACFLITLRQTASRDTVRFKRKYGSTPLVYLLEDLVRQGNVRFDFGRLAKSGKELVRLLAKRGLIKKSFLFQEVKVLPPGIQLAKARRLRL